MEVIYKHVYVNIHKYRNHKTFNSVDTLLRKGMLYIYIYKYQIDSSGQNAYGQLSYILIHQEAELVSDSTVCP